MPLSRETRDRNTSMARVLANRYEVIQKIGSGSFGSAFLCKDLQCNGQLKVLKEIPVGELQPDETFDAVKEAKLLSKLDHIGVVKFHDSFIDGEFFCIITEYCEGGDLSQKIEEYKEADKSFDESTILDWTVQILLAAQYIHSRRVLHRDLKTKNIFIHNNFMKIGDFGISRILMETADKALTFTGTLNYMSPEVIKHNGYNSKSDIWSIGCIMYELCSLERAFPGKILMTIMNKIVGEEPPNLPPKYSKELNKVFKKIVVKEPENRPSAADVLKFPYIASHMEKMKDEYKADLKLCPVTANREANELASLMREKSYVNDQQRMVKSPSGLGISKMADQHKQHLEDKKLTPREKMHLRRKLEADKEAQRLKEQTRLQLQENQEKRQNNKSNIEKTNLPSWKNHNGEVAIVKQVVPVKNVSNSACEVESSTQGYFDTTDKDKNTKSDTIARRHSEKGSEVQRNPVSGSLTRSCSQKLTKTVSGTLPSRMNMTIGGTHPDDRQITPMKDKMVYSREYSSLDFEDGMPDTPDVADTYYEQYCDFDEDDDDNTVIDSDDTLRENKEDLIHHLERALNNENEEEETIVNDDYEHGAYGPHALEIKIKKIRSECIKALGSQVYEKVYNYLKTARYSQLRENRTEKEIVEGLKSYVKNPSDCFIVDQLLFLEEQTSLNQ